MLNADIREQRSRPATPPVQRRGRGAVANRSGRFERQARRPTFDGWAGDGWSSADFGPEEAPLRTSVTVEHPRRIITRNTSPDVPFDHSINPYRGCEHGCSYCYARPSHAFMGLSPGLDFESKLFAKPDAPRLLERELGKKGYKPKKIALGTNTDPYQPIEKTWQITRGILEVLARWNHPLTIVTKSDMILRDLDILGPMAKRHLVSVGVSVTTLDHRLSRKMEPRATTPWKRIAAIDALTRAGVPVAVFFAPVIPALNDHELEAVLDAAAKAGATEARYMMLRLPLELADLFEGWLRENFPHRADRVLSHLRAMRNGKMNDPRFHARMRGSGPYADLISRRFRLTAKRLGLNQRTALLRSNLFVRPLEDQEQLALF